MTNERRFTKKLLLIALAINVLAFIPAQRSDAQTTTTVLVPRTEGLSFGFPSGYYGSPRYLNYYPHGYSGHPYVHYYPHGGIGIHIIPHPRAYSEHKTYHHRQYLHRHHSE